MTLPEDTVLENRFRIDRLLAHGGMGAIYRGFDMTLSIPVAIKENFFQTPQNIQQFQQEARILARLRHPGLPRVFHHFNFEGQYYLVMDFIEGQDLWALVKKQGHPLAEAQAIEYMLEVCDAVSYLHRRELPIIHRDIKPQNIKITPDNRAVLVDFGIAKMAEAGSRTRTGAQAVTPGFSPPEQYSGIGTTPVSDVYSLGATLYAVLTGKKPPDSISLLVSKAKFKPPNVINTALSNQTSQAIMYAMQPQREDRPQSVAAWKKELQTALDLLTKARQDKEDTLPGTVKSAEIEPAVAPAAVTTHWLVDPTGLGYALGPESLVIGRHSNADVMVKAERVSRQHALIRMEGQRCLVMDNGSANGTFLNDHRLGLEWHPMKPGDVLMIGPARFSLTTNQPARVAPLPSKVASATDEEIGTVFEPDIRSTPPPVSVPPVPSPLPSVQPVSPPPVAAQPARPKKVSILIPIIAAVVILLGLLGATAYFLISSTASSSATATAVAQNAMVAETQTAEAIAAEAEMTMTTQARAEAAAKTRQAEQEAATATVTEVSAAEKTVTVENTPTETVTPTPVPPTATPTEIPPTATPTTKAMPTAIPTKATTPTVTPSPIPAGPTLIPLKSEVSVPQIGVREVTDVDINLKNPKEVYVLVKGDGIYKSTNGGDGPWAKMDLAASAVTAFTIDSTNPARLYAPTWNAVLRSDDGGNTWKAFGNGLSTANQAVDVVTIDPANPNLLYAGIGSTLVVSTDGGETWLSDGFGNGLGRGRLTSITVDPFNHDIVFIGGEFGSIYKSVDSGRNFKQLAGNTGKGTYSLIAHPTQKDVYLAGINSYEAGIIRTENAADFVSASNGLIFGGADSAYSAIVFAPSNPNIIYAGTGYEDDRFAKGIFKSTDGGKSWDSVSNGLNTNSATGQPHYVKSIAVHPTNPDIVIAATGGGLFKSTDGGNNWVLQ